MAQREIDTGLSAVCAYCERWHEAIDRGTEVMCGRLQCGGPTLGRGFPAYKGPMQGQLHTICFICGKSAQAGVEIGDRMIGVCNRMGPKNQTCMDKLREIMSRNKVVVKEHFVPTIGGGRRELAE